MANRYVTGQQAYAVCKGAFIYDNRVVGSNAIGRKRARFNQFDSFTDNQKKAGILASFFSGGSVDLVSIPTISSDINPGPHVFLLMTSTIDQIGPEDTTADGIPDYIYGGSFAGATGTPLAIQSDNMRAYNFTGRVIFKGLKK